HPTLEGYFLVADAFYDALGQSPLLSGGRAVPEAAARAERLATPIDSLLGVLRVRRLMSEWPFQPAGSSVRLYTLTGPTPIDSVAWRTYKQEMDWLGATRWLVDHYAQQGALDAAFRTQLALVQELPMLEQPRTAAGNLLMAMGRYDEAAE